jgi:hypothetical protein
VGKFIDNKLISKIRCLGGGEFLNISLMKILSEFCNPELKDGAFIYFALFVIGVEVGLN